MRNGTCSTVGVCVFGHAPTCRPGYQRAPAGGSRWLGDGPRRHVCGSVWEGVNESAGGRAGRDAGDAATSEPADSGSPHMCWRIPVPRARAGAPARLEPVAGAGNPH
mgnify:CR=1 FL=1